MQIQENAARLPRKDTTGLATYLISIGCFEGTFSL